MRGRNRIRRTRNRGRRDILNHVSGIPYCKGHFDPVALNIHDVYIVNNHGEELKAKAPPLIGYAMFQI